MPRRAHSRRTYRRTFRRSSSAANPVVFAALFALLGALIGVTAKLLFHAGQLLIRFVAWSWCIAIWRQADQRGRMVLSGTLAGAVVPFFGMVIAATNTPALAALAQPQGKPMSFSAAPPPAIATLRPTPRPSTIMASVVRNTSLPVQPLPTSTPPPTRTPAPPTVGEITGSANLRALAGADEESLGVLCKGDGVWFTSHQFVGAMRWHRVQLVSHPADCSSRVKLGTVGWVSSELTSSPESITTIDRYAKEQGIALPTARPGPKRPTATFQSPAVKPPAQPNGGRSGAICRDDTRANATGRGACSHHGGVSRWLYQ